MSTAAKAIIPPVQGIIVAARHGERQDYVQRDSPEQPNWIPTTTRPWDPPLSKDGHAQVQQLGRRVARSLRQHNLPPVTAVYCSPLLRCCQTAAGAVVGLEEEEEQMGRTSTGGSSSKLKIRIEHGIVESLCEKWYRSWCLPGSDGTWGYCPEEPTVAGSDSVWDVDIATIHPMAKIPSPSELFLSRADMEKRLRESCGEVIQTRSGDIVDQDYTESIAPLADNFCWGTFESRKMQLARASELTTKLAARHPGETILLLSHGSPVTHMFEVITGKDWTVHGVCGYASFSAYAHERMVNDGDDGDGEEGICIVWKEPLVTNDSTHVLDETSAEYKSGH
mmetsp:Transcript_11969/g.25325  ORF Transcript_11969/g.25325 Transcript_11969/m.25325 type:complete len:337 (+) Transcript_11969:28-1038(+)